MKRSFELKNLTVCILVAAIVVIGCGGGILRMLYRTAAHSYHLLKGDETFEEFTGNVEKTISDNLAYHDALVDLNSLMLRYSGASYVIKDDSTIVKMKNGYLAEQTYHMSDRAIANGVDKINALYEFTKEAGADFLYVMCPMKGYHSAFPAGLENDIPSNCDRFAEALRGKGIPALILQEKMDAIGMSEEEAYFATDHHWKPNTGFWAFGEICAALHERYGFEYDTNYTDISRYAVQTYDDWFLGSLGKKTGRFFTELGVDDIDLITPYFETLLTEEQPVKNESRTGTFEESVLFMDNIKTRNYYGKNPYATYCGGDFRLQILTNHLSNTGKTMLIVRDSFACSVTPFLALTADTIYLMDVRNYSSFVGEKQSVYEQIKAYDPDYVMVIYTGPAVPTGLGNLDFE